MAAANIDDGHQDHLSDPIIDKLHAEARRDEEYCLLADAVNTGFSANRSEGDQRLKSYFGVHDQLSIDEDIILYGQRIVIPRAACTEVLN